MCPDPGMHMARPTKETRELNRRPLTRELYPRAHWPMIYLWPCPGKTSAFMAKDELMPLKRTQAERESAARPSTGRGGPLRSRS